MRRLLSGKPKDGLPDESKPAAGGDALRGAYRRFSSYFNGTAPSAAQGEAHNGEEKKSSELPTNPDDTAKASDDQALNDRVFNAKQSSREREEDPPGYLTCRGTASDDNASKERQDGELGEALERVQLPAVIRADDPGAARRLVQAISSMLHGVQCPRCASANAVFDPFCRICVAQAPRGTEICMSCGLPMNPELHDCHREHLLILARVYVGEPIPRAFGVTSSAMNGFLEDGTRCCIKMRKIHFGEEPGRVAGEVAALQNLKHPNILAFHSVLISHSHLCIVTPLGDGTLYDFALGHPLRREEEWIFVARALMRDVVEGVAYMHELGYVHKDIKSSNMFLFGERCVVGDLGDAERLPPCGWTTRVGGTLSYMDPVSVQKKRFSLSTDVYSLAVTAIELVSSRPVSGRGVEIRSGNYFPLMQLGPGRAKMLLASLCHLLDMCLCQQDERISSRDMLQHEFFALFPNVHVNVLKSIRKVEPKAEAHVVVENAQQCAAIAARFTEAAPIEPPVDAPAPVLGVPAEPIAPSDPCAPVPAQVQPHANPQAPPGLPSPHQHTREGKPLKAALVPAPAQVRSQVNPQAPPGLPSPRKVSKDLSHQDDTLPVDTLTTAPNPAEKPPHLALPGPRPQEQQRQRSTRHSDAPAEPLPPRAPRRAHDHVRAQEREEARPFGPNGQGPSLPCTRLCPDFEAHGLCPRGDMCEDVHNSNAGMDSERLAMGFTNTVFCTSPMYTCPQRRNHDNLHFCYRFNMKRKCNFGCMFVHDERLAV